MNKFKKLSILVFFIFFTSIKLRAVLVSASLYEKDDQRILVLGDQHARSSKDLKIQYYKLDKRDLNLINEWLDKLKINNIPVHFILECSEWELNKINKHINKNRNRIGLLLMFPYYFKSKSDLGSLTYTLADSREKKIKELVGFLSFFKIPECNDIDFLKQKILEFRNSFSGSLKDFFESIELKLNAIRLFLNSSKTLTLSEKEHLQELLTSFSEECTKKKNFFAEDEEDYNREYISLFYEIATNALFGPSYINDIYYMLFLKLTNSFADLFFKKQLLESLHSHKSIVFFGGHIHTLKISEYLKKQGYNILYKREMIRPYLDVFSFRSQFEIDELKKLLDSAFDRSVNNFNWCSKCLKPAKNKCGRCGQVYYCSRECMVPHWKSHHKFHCQKR